MAEVAERSPFIFEKGKDQLTDYICIGDHHIRVDKKANEIFSHGVHPLFSSFVVVQPITPMDYREELVLVYVSDTSKPGHMGIVEMAESLNLVNPQDSSRNIVFGGGIISLTTKEYLGDSADYGPVVLSKNDSELNQTAKAAITQYILEDVKMQADNNKVLS